MNKKQLYAAPATEVLELRIEGSILINSDQNATGQSIAFDDGE